MSLDARPSPWRVLFERKALWLAVPAIALLAGLAMIGSWSVSPPATVAQAEPVAPTSPSAAAPVSPAKSEAVATFTPEQKQELGKIIKDYLARQSGDLARGADRARSQDGEGAGREAQGCHRRERRRDLSRSQAPTSPATRTATSPSSSSSTTTAATASAACTTCIKLRRERSKVRVVFKELPILSKGSEEASRVALAAELAGQVLGVPPGDARGARAR